MTALMPQIPIAIQNDSGQIIPPRSVVVVTSVEMVQTGPGQETIAIHHVTQYGCGVDGNVFVTGPSAIAATSRDTSAFPGSRALGTAYVDQFLYVAIDSTVAAPVSGEEWGPSDGSWLVTRGGKGFWAQGYAATGDSPDRSMFLRTFVRAPATKCSSSSTSASASGSGSVSGSTSARDACNCATVLADVFCVDGALVKGYIQVAGCCGGNEGFLNG